MILSYLEFSCLIHDHFLSHLDGVPESGLDVGAVSVEMGGAGDGSGGGVGSVSGVAIPPQAASSLAHSRPTTPIPVSSSSSSSSSTCAPTTRDVGSVGVAFGTGAADGTHSRRGGSVSMGDRSCVQTAEVQIAQRLHARNERYGPYRMSVLCR